MIHVENLYHSYTHDERYAVKGVTFDVAEGEILGFLGPNGAGKSTTQKVLTGVIPYSEAWPPSPGWTSAGAPRRCAT